MEYDKMWNMLQPAFSLISNMSIHARLCSNLWPPENELQYDHLRCHRGLRTCWTCSSEVPGRPQGRFRRRKQHTPREPDDVCRSFAYTLYSKVYDTHSTVKFGLMETLSMTSYMMSLIYWGYMQWTVVTSKGEGNRPLFSWDRRHVSFFIG